MVQKTTEPVASSSKGLTVGVAPLTTTDGPTMAASSSGYLDPSTLSTELQALYAAFQSCLDLRDKYIRVSRQRLEDNPQSYDGEFWVDDAHPDGGRSAPFPPWKIYPEPPKPHWQGRDAWSNRTQDEDPSPQKPNEFHMDECEIPGIDRSKVAGNGWDFALDDKGVYQVFDPDVTSTAGAPKPLFDIPSIKDYFLDLEHILSVISDGPNKSFAWRRLRYLESKWDMYTLLNEYQELADMKRVPHR